MRVFIYVLWIHILWANTVVAKTDDPLHVVIDMEGTLVKSVFQSHMDHTQSVPIFQTQIGNFALRPHAKEVLEELSQIPNIKLSFVSNFDALSRRDMEIILNQIQIDGKNLKDSAYKIVGPESLSHQQIDLEDITGDLSNTVFISDAQDSVLPGQEEHQYTAGSYYYAFDTEEFWEKQRKTINEVAPQYLKYVPKNSSDWNRERNKWKGIHTLLREVRTGQMEGKSLPKTIKAHNKIDSNIEGFNPDSPINQPYEYQWSIVDGVVVGCHLQFPLLKRTTSMNYLNACLDHLETTYQIIDPIEQTCGLYTADGSGLIESTEPLNCFGEKGQNFIELKKDYAQLCQEALICNQSLAEVGGFMTNALDILSKVDEGKSENPLEKNYAHLFTVLNLAREKFTQAEQALWDKQAFELEREKVMQELHELIGQCEFAKQYAPYAKDGHSPAFVQELVESTSPFGPLGQSIFDQSLEVNKECIDNQAQQEEGKINPLMLERGCPTRSLISALGTLLNEVIPAHVKEQTGDDNYTNIVQRNMTELLSKQGSKCQWDDSLRKELNDAEFTEGNFNWYTKRPFEQSAQEYRHCVTMAYTETQKQVDRFKELKTALKAAPQELAKLLDNDFKNFSLSVKARQLAQEYNENCLGQMMSSTRPQPQTLNLGCPRMASVVGFAHDLDQQIQQLIKRAPNPHRATGLKSLFDTEIKNCTYYVQRARLNKMGQDLWRSISQDGSFISNLKQCQAKLESVLKSERDLASREERFLNDLKTRNIDEIPVTVFNDKKLRLTLFSSPQSFDQTFEAYAKHALSKDPKMGSYIHDDPQSGEVTNKIWNDYLKTCIASKIKTVSSPLGHCLNDKKSQIDSYLSTLLTPAQASLLKDWSPYVQTLKRNVYTYHWYDTNYDYETQGRDYMKLIQWYRSAWDKFETGDSGEMGYGLYSAKDPHSSSGYGDKMVRIEIPEGTPYLDIRTFTNHYPPLSSTTKRLLREAGCQPRGYSSGKKTFSRDKDCHDLLQFAIDHLGVQFMVYKWSDDDRAYCQTPENLAFYFTTFSINTSNTIPVKRNDEDKMLKKNDNYKRFLFGCDPKTYPTELRIPSQ